MRNILLLFSKLNPAIRYVQGMNEVLAPIYYVFSTDTDEQNAVRINFILLFFGLWTYINPFVIWSLTIDGRYNPLIFLENIIWTVH